MNEQTGDPATRTLAEQEALATGHAWLHRGRVIPIISGGEDPPDPAAETPAADPPSEPVRPEWLPEQYADETAFANAHREAQRKISEQGNELRDMREQMEELSSLVQEQPAQPSFTDPNQNPFVLAYQRAVDEGDVAAQLAIQAQLMDTVVQQRMETADRKGGSDQRGLDPYLVGQMRDQIAARHQADDALNAKAMEIMESHPVVSARLKELDKDPTATMGDLAPVVDTAYELAKLGRVNAEQTSLAQQQAEAEAARQRKIDSETLSGSGPTRVASQSEQEQAWDRISGANLNQMPRVNSQ